MWHLQKKKLGGAAGPSWKFAAFWEPTVQTAECDAARQWLAGTIMSVRVSIFCILLSL